MKFKNKKAESSIGTAITVLISVVLGGLVLTGVIALIDNNVSPTMEKTFSEQQINISRVIEEEDKYTPGDINKDGVVNELDYQYLANYISGVDGYASPTIDVGDLNNDGKINSKDLDILHNKIITSQNMNFELGDINKDGVIDKDDYEYLNRYVSGWDGYDNPDLSVCDINGDGEVNDTDLQLLKAML